MADHHETCRLLLVNIFKIQPLLTVVSHYANTIRNKKKKKKKKKVLQIVFEGMNLQF
jgi:hypothetical protein